MNYRAKWEGGMTYLEYRKLVAELIENSKSTGPVQSEDLLRYSILNQHRMNRLDKTVEFGDSIEHVENLGLKALVITEGWCGDAAQSVPVFEQFMSKVGVEVRYVLRDEHDDLMALHLTNGAKSIPIMVLLDDEFKLIGQWGPRPRLLQEMVMEYKHQPEPKKPYSEFSKDIQLWYANDKQAELIAEWKSLLEAVVRPAEGE